VWPIDHLGKPGKLRAELFHNLAVDFWICANALWMLLEFTGKE